VTGALVGVRIPPCRTGQIAKTAISYWAIGEVRLGASRSNPANWIRIRSAKMPPLQH
jgi:hypothetical protein